MPLHIALSVSEHRALPGLPGPANAQGPASGHAPASAHLVAGDGRQVAHGTCRRNEVGLSMAAVLLER